MSQISKRQENIATLEAKKYQIYFFRLFLAKNGYELAKLIVLPILKF